VARDLARLEERKRELNQKHPDLLIETLRADLTVESDIAAVESRVLQGIDLLINNAGFGINKSFTRSSLVSERELLTILVEVPMRLAHQAIPAMLEKKNGLIINVSSVAAFIAGGTYSAAKSYLTILSESLHSELKSEGVKVLALCPGFTRTEFHQRGRMRMTGLPSFLWLSADFVTEVAWRDLHRGKAISVPGWQYKLLMGLIRSLPRPLVRRYGLRVKSKQRRD
jgi:short-subunit dehydrogenase